MSASQVIAAYESLSALSGQMRAAAANGEWDRLIGIELERGQAIDALKLLDAGATLDEAQREQKNRMIEQVLDDDAEVRRRTEAWMSQLQLDIQSNRQEQLLLQAYGA